MDTDILITTTNIIEGSQITHYLGVINASIVVGTNLFSDFFAGLSDIFGGTSKTYQKQLQNLYSFVLEELIGKAKLLHADAIVGLQIDFDELSAQNKSMFMMNAVGTAVKTLRTSDHFNHKVPNQVLDRESFENIQIISQIRGKITSGIVLDDDEIRFMLSNRISGCEDYFYKRLFSNVSNYGYSTNDYTFDLDMLKNYIGLFSVPEKIKMIYPYLEQYSNQSDFFLELLKELHILDYAYIKRAINSRDMESQLLALKLIGISNESYTQENISDYMEIASQIRANIPYNYEEEAPQKKWTCFCGKTNPPDRQYCTKCSKDMFGFTEKDINPKQAIEGIQETIMILESYFETR